MAVMLQRMTQKERQDRALVHGMASRIYVALRAAHMGEPGHILGPLAETAAREAVWLSRVVDMVMLSSTNSIARLVLSWVGREEKQSDLRGVLPSLPMMNEKDREWLARYIGDESIAAYKEEHPVRKKRKMVRRKRPAE